eukprot:759338-Pyramimonas_sp.AAC.1
MLSFGRRRRGHARVPTMGGGGLGTIAHHHHGHSCDAVGEASGWLQADSLAPLHLQGVYQDQDRPRTKMGGQPHASILHPGLRTIYD